MGPQKKTIFANQIRMNPFLQRVSIFNPFLQKTLSNYPPQITYYGTIIFSPFSHIKIIGPHQRHPSRTSKNCRPWCMLLLVFLPQTMCMPPSSKQIRKCFSSFNLLSPKLQWPKPRPYHSSRSLECSSSCLSTRLSRTYAFSSGQPASFVNSSPNYTLNL